MKIYLIDNPAIGPTVISESKTGSRVTLIQYKLMFVKNLEEWPVICQIWHCEAAQLWKTETVAEKQEISGCACQLIVSLNWYISVIGHLLCLYLKTLQSFGRWVFFHHQVSWIYLKKKADLILVQLAD
jgi:hypothetical protein